MAKFEISYDSNNSGGDWWLMDEDWFALERAGWKIGWIKDKPSPIFQEEVKRTGRFLMALATDATLVIEAPDAALALIQAISNWEIVTGQDAGAEGCSCCGQPHYFSVADTKEIENA